MSVQLAYCKSQRTNHKLTTPDTVGFELGDALGFTDGVVDGARDGCDEGVSVSEIAKLVLFSIQITKERLAITAATSADPEISICRLRNLVGI
jgi:hypothetical protein